MRGLLVCTAFCSLLSASALASSEDLLSSEPVPPRDLLFAPELQPTSTSFAYRVRHGTTELPGSALSALWFSGDDQFLPRTAVTEPIVVVPAQAARLAPTRNALCNHAAMVAAEHDLPAPFFANLIQQESGFKSHVVSPAGAQGIAQFMPRVARAYGLENPFDPLHSLSVSAKFLRELLGQFGNLGLAAAAYNAGPKRVQDWMAKRGKLPEETRNYVRNITGQPAERWARVNVRTEETRLPAHARCPGMPVMAVSIPESAPVKAAKGASKATKAVAMPAELPKTAAAKVAGPKMPKSVTLASAAPGKKVAVIRNGKIQITAGKIETGSKHPAGKKVAAAKIVAAAKENKSVSKSAGKSATRIAAKSAPVAKSQARLPSGKRVKLAAAR